MELKTGSIILETMTDEQAGDLGKRMISPENFKFQVERIIRENQDDLEAMHGELDGLMFEFLQMLGYEEGVKLIKGQDLYYA